MENLGNFCGHVVGLQKTDETLRIRLLSWNAYNEDIQPVLTLAASSYSISANSAPSLEEAKNNELEVDGIEIDDHKVSIWIYDFEEPIVVECGSLAHPFEELGPAEIRLVLAASRKHHEAQYQQIASLRKRLNAVEQFIAETERRIHLKAEGHAASSEAAKAYNHQLELLRRIKCKLKDA